MSQTSLSGGSLTVKPNGDLLRSLRKKVKGRRQSDVESEAGLPSPRLWLYEKGEPISINHLNKLADYYRVSAKSLVELESLAQNANLLQELAVLHQLQVVSSPA